MVKPEDPVVKPEDPPVKTEDPPVKTEPTDDDQPMVETPPLVVPVPMPDIRRRLTRALMSSFPAVNQSSYYNVDGKLMTGGNEIGAAELFHGICPDRYSGKYTDIQQAAKLSGSSGLFGHAAYVDPVTHDKWGDAWWGTYFSTEFTIEKDASVYISKNGVSGGSERTLMGACCQVDFAELYEASRDSIYLKWGSHYGNTATTPLMQFTAENEDGTHGVYNYTVNIPYYNGEVHVELLEARIMRASPKNGCFFTMDLRDGLVYFHMMDVLHSQNNNVPRDWVEDPNPKEDDPESEEESDEEEPEPTPAPTPVPTTKLTALPKFYVVQGVNDGAYGGALFDVNLSRSGLDRTHTWLPSFSGYDAASIEGPGQLVPTLAECQHATGVDVGQLLGYSGGFISFAALYAYQVQGQFIQWYSGWLATASTYEMCGWLIRQSDGKAGFVFTEYGYTSTAPRASRSGQTTYTLTSANVQTELISQMMIPGQSAVGRPSCLGFAYDARVGDYGQVTWLSQI